MACAHAETSRTFLRKDFQHVQAVEEKRGLERIPVSAGVRMRVHAHMLRVRATDQEGISLETACCSA
jgi:hypothetical protein